MNKFLNQNNFKIICIKFKILTDFIYLILDTYIINKNCISVI